MCVLCVYTQTKGTHSACILKEKQEVKKYGFSIVNCGYGGGRGERCEQRHVQQQETEQQHEFGEQFFIQQFGKLEQFESAEQRKQFWFKQFQQFEFDRV